MMEHSGDGRARSVMAYSVSRRIALLDNDPRALLSVRQLIEDRLAPSQVIWMAERGEDAIRQCRDARTMPDLLVVDMSLEGLQGASVCRRIRARSPRPALLGITSFSMRRYRRKASDAGLQGLVGKSDENEILDGIRRVAVGAVFDGFDTAQVAHLRLRHDHSVNLLLTIREEQVINLLAVSGLRNVEIADALGIEESTVRKHLQHIVAKLGASSVRQAAAIWLERAE